MRTSYGIFQDHMMWLNFCEEKLKLKDTGLNTDNIIYIQRQIEKTRREMLKADDTIMAIDIFRENIYGNKKLRTLLEKYNIDT